MRVFQAFLFLCFSRNTLKKKAMNLNIFSTIVALGLTVGLQVGALSIAKEEKEDLMNEWQKAFTVVLLVDVFIMDLILLPIAIAIYLKIKKTGYKNLSPAFTCQ